MSQQLCCHGMCKNLLRSDAQQRSYSKAKFPSNLNCGQKNVSETGPWSLQVLACYLIAATHSEIILCKHTANEKWGYNVTWSLIGWHTQRMILAHHLNQCWFIIDKVLCNRLEDNFIPKITEMCLKFTIAIYPMEVICWYWTWDLLYF